MSGDGNPRTSKEMKKSWKSKTILFNAGAAVAAVVFPEAVAMLSPEQQFYGMAVANIFLRFLTDRGVKLPFVK